MVDFSVIEQKWQSAWDKAKIGNVKVDKKRVQIMNLPLLCWIYKH